MRQLALLRGINVGGTRKVPMAELRQVAEAAGLTEVATYIQSGNMVFEAGRAGARATAERLEAAIEDHFGFPVEVICRTATRWRKDVAANPFGTAARARPNLVLLGLCKKPCRKGAAAALRERARQGERVRVEGDVLWIDFVKSVGRSKLTPAVLDRAAGATVTMRNWRTVQKLSEMLAG